MGTSDNVSHYISFTITVVYNASGKLPATRGTFSGRNMHTRNNVSSSAKCVCFILLIIYIMCQGFAWIEFDIIILVIDK